MKRPYPHLYPRMGFILNNKALGMMGRITGVPEGSDYRTRIAGVRAGPGAAMLVNRLGLGASTTLIGLQI